MSSIDAALAHLPEERRGHPAPPDLALRREGMDAAKAAGTWAVDPPPAEVQLGGRRSLIFRPPGRIAGRVLHLHGGAFRLGTPEIEGPLATALAARCQVEVIAPQYRLAPEHPFPAGLRDAFAVLCALMSDDFALSRPAPLPGGEGLGVGERGEAARPRQRRKPPPNLPLPGEELDDSSANHHVLAEQTDNLPLILSGDSAGGGLAASLTMLAIQAGLPIAGLVLLSPWLDLTVSAPSYAANAASDPLFSRESAASGAALYLQGCDPQHPLASPLFGDVTGFPRTLISVGTGEVVADDAHRFHARLTAAGVPSTLCAIAGMEHVAVVRSLALPGAAETFAAIAQLVGDITTAASPALDLAAPPPA